MINVMAGQKMEREARFEATGLTPAQRLEYVRRRVNAGWSERQIARALGVCPATAHHLVHEVRTGQKRVSIRQAMCEGCWEDFPAKQLNRDGLCPDCAQT